MKHATDATFTGDTAEGVVLVDFHASWCGPCKRLDPIVEALSARVNVVKVDVDAAPETAARLGVRSVPTLLVMKGGHVLDQRSGVMTETAIERWIAEVTE